MIHPISISFCISKDTEVDIPDNKSATDTNAKNQFLQTEHFKHIIKMLKSAGFFIDEFNVILNN